MTSEESPQARLRAILSMPPERFAKWQYFEDRAAHLGERLWSMGTWLLALIGTSLALPFVASFVTPIATLPFLKVEKRVALALLAIFGILLCIYSYTALRDLREHIESNWRKAGNILEGTWRSEWKGRKNHGWKVLLAADAAALLCFLGLLILVLLGA